MLNKGSFINFMHAAASARETRVVYKSLHSNSLKTGITPKLATAITFIIIYKHGIFLRHKVICALPNATVL